MLEYIAFLYCLEFAICNSLYCGAILKPKQVTCLESAYLQKDVLCVLPTGYGKSLIFHLLPGLLFAKDKLKLNIDFLVGWKSRGITAVTSIVIVVSPLNSLIVNQIERLSLSGIRASVLSVKEKPEEQEDNVSQYQDEDDDGKRFECDFGLCEEQKLRNGRYHIVFSHPETFISSEYGRKLLLTKVYRDNVVAIVIDEAHCILDWLVLH